MHCSVMKEWREAAGHTHRFGVLRTWCHDRGRGLLIIIICTRIGRLLHPLLGGLKETDCQSGPAPSKEGVALKACKVANKKGRNTGLYEERHRV